MPEVDRKISTSSSASRHSLVRRRRRREVRLPPVQRSRLERREEARDSRPNPTPGAAQRLAEEAEETHRLNDRLRTSVDRLDALVSQIEQFAEAFRQRAALHEREYWLLVVNREQQLEQARALWNLESRLELIEQRLSDQQRLISLTQNTFF